MFRVLGSTCSFSSTQSGQTIMDAASFNLNLSTFEMHMAIYYHLEWCLFTMGFLIE